MKEKHREGQVLDSRLRANEERRAALAAINEACARAAWGEP
jgi:hypothetical protein